MTMPSPNKIKRVRGWCEIKNGKIVYSWCPNKSSYMPNIQRKKKQVLLGWPGNEIVSCEITYSLPKKGKK